MKCCFRKFFRAPEKSFLLENTSAEMVVVFAFTDRVVAVSSIAEVIVTLLCRRFSLFVLSLRVVAGAVVDCNDEEYNFFESTPRRQLPGLSKVAKIRLGCRLLRLFMRGAQADTSNVWDSNDHAIKIKTGNCNLMYMLSSISFAFFVCNSFLRFMASPSVLKNI